MIINQLHLRNRRLQLGLSKRELADSIAVTTTLITRLEETGDASLLQVKTLTSLLQNLGLNMSDVISSVESVEEKVSTPETRELGQILFQSRRELSKSQIAKSLGMTLEEVDALLVILDSKLKIVGLRIHQTYRGIKIIAGAQSGNLGKVAISARRSRSFDVLNLGDLSLLFKVINENLGSNHIMGSANGKVSLHKLLNATLVQIDADGRIVPTSQAFSALGYESCAS